MIIGSDQAVLINFSDDHRLMIPEELASFPRLSDWCSFVCQLKTVQTLLDRASETWSVDSFYNEHLNSFLIVLFSCDGN